MFYLGSHREHLQNCLDEISVKFPNPDSFYNSEYLRNILKETLRLRPSAPLRGRTFTENSSILNFPIYKNTTIALCWFPIHLDPTIWGENSQKFHPPRWVHPPTQPGAYLPFGAGLRRCIGELMASREAAVVLGRLMQKIEWEISEKSLDPLMELNITMKMKGGLWLKVKPKNK